MQSFCDLETDQMSATRFAGPATNDAAPTRAQARESWLDRLARALAPVPVDHLPIVPRHLSAAHDFVQAQRCGATCGASAE